MSINNNYKQEYLNACIYKAHKIDKWAKLYEQNRITGLNMTPNDMFDFIEDDINCPIDIENGMYGDTIVGYKTLQNALIEKDCHIFADGDKYFTIDKGNLEQFSYDYRKESNRVDEKIIITEIVPCDERQKLLVITDGDADRDVIINIISTRLNIEPNKIRFVNMGKLYVYVDIITKNIQERVNLADILSHDDSSKKFNINDIINNRCTKKTYKFDLPEIEIFNKIQYYEHVIIDEIAIIVPKDFDKRNKLNKNVRKRFHAEFICKILVDDSEIEDTADEDKIMSNIVNNYNYTNCSVVHCNDAKNVSNTPLNTNKNIDFLKKLGTKLSETCEEATFIELQDLLRENNFDVKANQNTVDLISKMGFKKHKNYWTHSSNVPKSKKK